MSLRIPQFLAYQEDDLMLVIPDSKYTYRVPLQLGTDVIGNIVQHIGPNNLAPVGPTWRNTFLSTGMAGKLVQRQANNPPFHLTLIDGPIVATQEIVLRPFETWDMKGATRVIGHTKRVNVIGESWGDLLTNRWSWQGQHLSVTSYNREVRIPTKSILGKVQAINEVPNLLVSEYASVGEGSHSCLGPLQDGPRQPSPASHKRRAHLKPH